MHTSESFDETVNKISSKLKDFAHSGTQNILRTFFTLLIGIAVMLITTFSMYRNIHFLSVIKCMIGQMKIWIPVLAAGIVFAILSILMKINPSNMVERYRGDKIDGVRDSMNDTYGSAGWLSKEDAKKTLEVNSIKNCKGIIVGSYDTAGREIVCVPCDGSSPAIKNLNLCIIGSPGEGKSWGHVRSNIMQVIRRGESLVATDPKGELVRDNYNLLINNGYKVKIVNIANPTKSDAWNCMNVCFNKETGNVDMLRVKEFVDAIMTNTSNSEEGDSYFANNERTLFEAVIMYMAESYLINMRHHIETIIEHTCRTDAARAEREVFLRRYARKDSPINSIIHDAEMLFVKYSNFEGTPEEKIAEFHRLLDEKNKSLIKPTISNVYCKFNNLKSDLLDFQAEVDAMQYPTALCHQPLRTIMQQAADVRGNFVNGCSVRLSILNDTNLRLMLSEDDIDLSAPGKEKCAYFCIFPDQTNAFRFVSSLFFTFLFKDQCDTADALGGPNKIAINYILDEFANIGVIPDFSKKIATLRSRNIGITMIIQAITQLYNNYTKDVANTLLGCCSTMMCLGVSDDDTAKYFEQKLGVRTIIARSTRDERKMGRIDRLLPEYAESLGEGKRELLTADEIRRLDPSEVIVVCSHTRPMLLKKVPASLHPLSGGGAYERFDISQIPPFIERYEGCEERDSFCAAELKATRATLAEIDMKMHGEKAAASYDHANEDAEAVADVNDNCTEQNISDAQAKSDKSEMQDMLANSGVQRKKPEQQSKKSNQEPSSHSGEKNSNSAEYEVCRSESKDNSCVRETTQEPVQSKKEDASEKEKPNRQSSNASTAVISTKASTNSGKPRTAEAKIPFAPGGFAYDNADKNTPNAPKPNREAEATENNVDKSRDRKPHASVHDEPHQLAEVTLVEETVSYEVIPQKTAGKSDYVPLRTFDVIEDDDEY